MWRYRRLLLAGLSVAIVIALHAAGLPVLPGSAEPFSFAVLGDLHLSRPAFEQARTVAAIAESLRDSQPRLAFVCQTGDLAHGEAEGHKQLDAAGMRDELSFAFACLRKAFGVPVFVAVGNHDKHGGGKPYREVALPFLAGELGVPLEQAYYAFRYGNACFIFLDYGDYSKKGGSMDYAAQRRFLDEVLAQARADPAVKHVFAFGHYPLWPAVRPGFSNDRFTDSAVPAFAGHPLDAYFCGHTHNTGAWVRRVGGAPVTQIMGVAMDASDPLRPMEETRTSLIPRTEVSYGWGYLSGPPCGYYWVGVEGPRVRVQLRSGRHVLRDFTWQEPGAVTDTLAPSVCRSAAPTEEELRRGISSAALVYTSWTSQAAELPVRINGLPAGTLRLAPQPDWAAFASEARLTLGAACAEGMRLRNEVMIDNPQKSYFGLGNLRLEIRLADGTVTRTAVGERYLLSAERDEAEAGKRSTLGWDIIPDAVRATVRLGESLGPARLDFTRDCR